MASERFEDVDGGNALRRVLGSACSSQAPRGWRRNLRAGTGPDGCMQSRQRFLHQLGDTPVLYQSAAPQGGKVRDGGTKLIVLNLSCLQNIHHLARTSCFARLTSPATDFIHKTLLLHLLCCSLHTGLPFPLGKLGSCLADLSNSTAHML